MQNCRDFGGQGGGYGPHVSSPSPFFPCLSPWCYFVCCAPPLPMVLVATPMAGNWTGTRLCEGRCEVVCSGRVVWLRVSRGVLGVLGVVNFRLLECVLVAFRRHGSWRNIIRGVGLRETLFADGASAKYYSRSGTPRNIIRGVGLREILFTEWDSAKYSSRSRPCGLCVVL